MRAPRLCGTRLANVSHSGIRLAIRFAAITIALSTAACATGGTAAGSSGTSPVVVPQAQTLPWPIKTREQVDLWLHGFALIQDDSSTIPFFRRGYRDEVTVLKNRANVLTQLDANVDRLSAQLRANRGLINAQFVPLYFSSVDQMHEAIDHFIASNGDPRAAESREEAAQFVILAGYFQTGQDRAFLSLFASSLWDENTKFFHSYWTEQQRIRANVIDSAQSLWQGNVRPRLQRVLNNTQQRNGDIILSLPLGGEGRTISTTGNTRNTTAVTFPARPSDVYEFVYVLAHELISPVVIAAVNDNTTPAQQRDGTADQFTSIGAVRGGLLWLENSAPDLADGYARFYLQQAGRTPGADPRAELVKMFPLPTAIRDAIARQLESAAGGI
jgi:hypothetical protein